MIEVKKKRIFIKIRKATAWTYQLGFRNNRLHIDKINLN
uniref:Pco155588b n=1 Tax=Arundo donax TaxID=35708 RepID=A0A0A9FX60_ARUDO